MDLHDLSFEKKWAVDLPDVLVEVVGAENGGVTRQVVEVVHDDRHKQVQHQEAGTTHQFLCVSIGNPADLLSL